MIRVGVTGGIGSGKTTVCKYLEYLNYPVYVADLEARVLQDSDPSIKSALKEIFGEDIYTAEEKLDRKKLAGVVFSDSKLLAKLNAVVHPVVERHFEDWCDRHSDSPVIFYESAILFESGNASNFDQTILVLAPMEVKIARVMNRDSVSRDEVLSRIDKQLDDESKSELASCIINNDDEHLVIPQVHKMLKNIGGL